MLNKLSGVGAFVGVIFGIHLILAFTFIFEPGRWLFITWPIGRAMLAYGYGMMAAIAICTLVGAALPPLFRYLRNALSAQVRP